MHTTLTSNAQPQAAVLGASKGWWHPLSRLAALVLMMTALVLAGCAEEDPEKEKKASGSSSAEETLDIVGSYTDDFGTGHEVTEDTWTQSSEYGDSVFNIEDFDNGETYLVAQNGADNTYSPELWSRFDWVIDGDTVYFCQIAYDAESQDDAEATEGADDDDLDAGCNGFGWTAMMPASSAPEAETLDIVGSYTDSFGTDHEVTEDTWTAKNIYLGMEALFNIALFDNDETYLVAQNGAENDNSPELWSRFDWVIDGDTVYYCLIAYDAESQDDAEATEGADDDDLDAGCNGYGWIAMTEVSE